MASSRAWRSGRDGKASEWRGGAAEIAAVPTSAWRADEPGVDDPVSR
ncbi:hypothetical protein [Nocardia sp. R7R-8]